MSDMTIRMRKPARLWASCALAGLAMAMAHPAHAQSFVGTGEPVLGSASITTAEGQTLVVVNSAETVIDWNAVDFLGTGNIDFQPEGTTATFTNGVSLSSYTVLNRITPRDGNGGLATSTVTFNGTVESFQDNAIGGNVWFYSPYGVIAGPTAVFNTGSLLLTTSAISIDNMSGGGSNLFGANGEIMFRSVASPGSFVEVQAGATITTAASAALVAPRIQMDGSVFAGGPIAYVAAETLDLRVNGGLFDITVLTGTTDANGITHTGTTTGPASTGNIQRIAMVAMPVSQALTMLLSGSIGYQPADVAIQDGSSVVLSAGYTTDIPSTVPATQTGSIDIGAATFSNDLTAYASDSITVDPGAELAQFSGSATLNALQSISIAQATAGTDMTLDAVSGPITLTGPVSANGAFTATTAGLFDISGTVQASTIDITSGGMAIGSAGQIGLRGITSSVTLTNANNDASMTLGGMEGGGYMLDAAEMQRIFADEAITFANGPGLVSIGDFALSYGELGNIGTGGMLKVLGNGRISITGEIALATNSAEDLFSIDPTVIEMQLDTASISMTGANGAPQGTLQLVGGTLIMADGGTIDAIYSASDLAEISGLLDAPASTANGGPVLTAGTIFLTATDALYIQNTGTGSGFADRQGFVAQELLISTSGPDTAIAINGQIITPSGTISGPNVTPLVTINDVPAAAGGQFDAGSTINGCIIGAVCNTPPPPTDGPEYIPTDTGPELDARLPEGDDSQSALPQIEIIEQEPLIDLPLVDEPITGVGNDDLWTSDCAEGEDSCE